MQKKVTCKTPNFLMSWALEFVFSVYAQFSYLENGLIFLRNVFSKVDIIYENACISLTFWHSNDILRHAT